MQQAFIILGPTSTGKTALTLGLCKKFNGAILSADSRQVYKYMDIGTGKIPINTGVKVIKMDQAWVVDGVNVHGYDLVKPDQFFSCYEYANFALRTAGEMIHKETVPFIIGGTGLYIDIVTGRVKPSLVEPDFSLRGELSRCSTDELVCRLKCVNASSLPVIDIKNRVRLIRAIEKSTKTKNYQKKLNYLKNVKFVYMGLTAPRAHLYQKADKWVEAVWGAGLVEETEWLIKNGYGGSPKLKGLVYKTVMEFLKGNLDRQSAIQRTQFDLHAYIRRQQTYFKNNSKIVWFDITAENYSENIYNFIERKLSIKNG